MPHSWELCDYITNFQRCSVSSKIIRNILLIGWSY